MSKNRAADGIFYESILNFLEQFTGSGPDMIASAYKMIRQEENQAAAFRFFLENADHFQKSGKEVEAYFTATELQKLSLQCDQLAAGILDHIIGRNLDEDTFYSELWHRGIEEDTNFSEEKEKIYAMYRFWADGRIPYFQLEEGMYMTEENFSGMIEEKEKDIKKAMFILNCRFSQKTERSSLLMKILDSCETEEEKAVLLAQILSAVEHRTYR